MRLLGVSEISESVVSFVGGFFVGGSLVDIVVGLGGVADLCWKCPRGGGQVWKCE